MPRVAAFRLSSRPTWCTGSGSARPSPPGPRGSFRRGTRIRGLRACSAPRGLCPGTASPSCYFMYYVGLHDTTLVPSTNCVGVAWSLTPSSPFTDLGPLPSSAGTKDQSGRPLGWGDDYGYGNIDPAPFVDRDGRAYLYLSTDRYCAQPAPLTVCPLRPTVSVIPLASDKWHAAGPRKPLFPGALNSWEQQPGKGPVVKSPWMEKRRSTSYLFSSAGDYKARSGIGSSTAY